MILDICLSIGASSLDHFEALSAISRNGREKGSFGWTAELVDELARTIA